MTRSQRRRHVWMWLVLGPLGLAVIGAGLAVRASTRPGVLSPAEGREDRP